MKHPKLSDQKTGAFVNDPVLDAFLLKLGYFIEEERLNPKILEAILRHLILVDVGTGFHTIEIVIRNHQVGVIKGVDTQKVDLPIRI